RLTIQAWDMNRNLVRRITKVADEKPGRIKLAVERFGKMTGTIDLIDLGRPQSEVVARRAARSTYTEQFRRSLLRRFPGWRIDALTSEPDLQHSLSPAYPRALLRKATAALAAIGVARQHTNVDGILTFGLIWLDYLRR